MLSFRNERTAIAFAYDAALINDEEFVLLYDSCRSKNPEIMHNDYPSFDLVEIDEVTCSLDFRFKKHEILLLVEALGLLYQFKCKQGTVCTGFEALCIALRRFAYPCRYSDLVPQFGRSVPELSMITNSVIDFIYERHGEKITNWNHDLLSPNNLKIYAEAIHQIGGALDNCFGFIDGTVRPICCLDEMQSLLYNGHKRVHAIKFQSITLPNGMIANFFGPFGKHIILLISLCLL